MEFLSMYIAPILIFLLAIIMVLAWFLVRRRICGTVVKSGIDYKQEAFKIVPYPIVILKKNDAILYLNAAAEKVLKVQLRRVMGKDYKSLFSLIDSETGLPIRDMLKLSESNAWKECELKLGAQQILTAELYTTLMVEEYQSTNLESYFLSFRDITQLKVIEAQRDILKKRDGLTNLHNREAFEALLDTVIHDSRKHGASHIFFHLSLDQFKNINDTIGGYNAGDSLIRQIAKLLQHNVDQSIDFISRLNTDEFGILFRERSITSAVEAMKHIRKAIDDFQFRWDGTVYPVTVSGGFVLINKSSMTSAARVLSEGHLTCRIARKRGGNRILAYRADDVDIKQAQNNVKGVWNLKQAFKDNRFQLYAQPIHALDSAKYRLPFSHYEVLIRMYDEKGNMVPPDEFIPIAEAYAMMPILDRWVVKDIVKQLRDVKQGTEVIPVFAVNLSGTSIDDEKFLEFVLNEIDAANIDPRMLCFEITEQVAVSNLALAEKFIETLRERGSSFSLDDFGTGVSSYGYLRSLNVDYLKIDGIFIKDILSDNIAKAMVQSIVQVGHKMGLKVIAEYVENDDIIEILRKMSIDYGQGYGISRPVPLTEMIQHHM